MATSLEVVHKLADVARDAWVWVRKPPDDPMVRARTALERIKARGEFRGLQWLEAEVRVVLGDRPVVTQVLNILSDNADALVYVAIANVAVERLQSGRHHISRNRLSPKGRQIYSAYKRAAARLLELGIYDAATYNADLAFVRQLVEDAG